MASSILASHTGFSARIAHEQVEVARRFADEVSCPSPVVDERAFLRRNWRTFKARVSEVPCPGAASSQQVALGGFTAAEAAHRLAECGYNELPENGCGDLLDSRLYSQTQSYLLISGA